MDLIELAVQRSKENGAARDHASEWMQGISRAVATGNTDAINDIIRNATDLEGATPGHRHQAGETGATDGDDRSENSAASRGDVAEESGS